MLMGSHGNIDEMLMEFHGNIYEMLMQRSPRTAPQTRQICVKLSYEDRNAPQR